MKLIENVNLKNLTTMRLGGEAKYVAEIETPADIKEAYEYAKTNNLPVFILGGGANTIAHDEPLNGLVVMNKMKGIEVIDETSDSTLIRAMGGEIWDDLVEFACERDLSGIEAMSLIPGTVGAAPIQNIGAYGQDVSQVIDHVEAYDTQTGEYVVLGPEEMQMGYRQTRFNAGEDKGRFFIIAMTIALSSNQLEPPFYNSLQKYLDDNKITDYSPMSIRKAVSAIRTSKLPDPREKASAGSFFKNIYFSQDDVLNDRELAAALEKALKSDIKIYDKPDGRKMINTGALIELAGLKGTLHHGMRVSNEAALVLINESAKSYADLAAARQEIVDCVYEKFGFRIEQEPVEIYTEDK